MNTVLMLDPLSILLVPNKVIFFKQTEDQILKLSTKLGLSPQDRAKMLGSLAAAEAVKDKRSTDDELSKY